MKTSSYIASLFLALILMCSVGTADAFAQSGKKGQSDKLQSMKVAFFTGELDLSTEEAESFWPVYNEYDAKRRALRKAAKNDDSAEATLANKESRVALDKAYLAKFKKVLPAEKVDRLYAAEKKWKEKLLVEMKKRKER